MRITLRDVKLTLLFLAGFVIAYIEGCVIAFVSGYPEPWRSIAWALFFGIFHSMLLFKIFRGGRFNWER